jgi:Na+/H+ antiporter NhaD/arsenite permease-like protein
MLVIIDSNFKDTSSSTQEDVANILAIIAMSIVLFLLILIGFYYAAGLRYNHKFSAFILLGLLVSLILFFIAIILV